MIQQLLNVLSKWTTILDKILSDIMTLKFTIVNA